MIKLLAFNKSVECIWCIRSAISERVILLWEDTLYVSSILRNNRVV